MSLALAIRHTGPALHSLAAAAMSGAALHLPTDELSGRPGPWGTESSAAQWAALSANSITVADADVFDITGALTLSAWIKPTALNTPEQSGIVTKWTSSGNQRSYALYLGAVGDGKIKAAVSGNGVQSSIIATGNTELVMGRWYHVCAVFVPSTSITIYLDGVQDGQLTVGIPASIYNSTSPIRIQQYVYDGGYKFVGSICLAGIADSALSAADVANLAGATSYAQYLSHYQALDGTHYLWPMDSTSNEIGQVYNGTIANGTPFANLGAASVRGMVGGKGASVVGSLTLGADGPVIQGDTGKAVSWPGGSVAYLNCGTDSAFDVGTGDFSWSVWFQGPENTAPGWRWLVLHNAYGYQPGLTMATNAGRIYCLLGTWPTLVSASNDTINTSDWYFLALTRVSGTVQAYLNGQPWGTPTTGESTDLGVARGVYIGRGPNIDAASQNASGLKISMPTFAAAGWSASEVAALYGEQAGKHLLIGVA